MSAQVCSPPRPAVAALYCRYAEVLGTQANRELMALAVAKQSVFSHSKTTPRRHYPAWRRSTVIYDDQLGGVAALVESTVLARLPEVLTALRVGRFPVGSIELQLTSHNDGEYYHWHTDNGSADTASRMITFVYYFHRLPRGFEGGELVFHRADGGQTVVEPQNDTLVMFASGTRHEVRPVACGSQRFEDGRFTLNGWIRRVAAPQVADHYGYWIFNPPRHTTEAPRRCEAAAAPTAIKQWRDDAACASLPAPACPGTIDDAWQSMRGVYAELHRQSRHARTIDVVSRITGTEFYEQYYLSNRPVLMKGGLSGSPAVGRWTPQYFREHFGSVPVQVTTGRDSDPDYEVNFRAAVTTITLGEFADRLMREPESNDYYLVARNYFFEQPGLQHLRDELAPPPDIINVADRGAGTYKLWLGPCGTVTPLHYDEHSILFGQVYGRKRFRLIPPFDGDKVYPRRRFYSEVDPEHVDPLRHPAFAQAAMIEIEVEAGDLLLLPVGWWHWARSLSVSISATFCSFHVQGRNTSLRKEHGARPHAVS